MKSLSYWLPPIIWMSVIFYFSTDSFSGENTDSIFWNIFHWLLPGVTREQFEPIHFLTRKTAHFVEYGILALLLLRAFRSGATTDRWRWRWAAKSFLVVVIYALLDEYHQTFTMTRGGSIYDSLIDISGGLMTLFLFWLLSRRGNIKSPRGRREET